MIDITRNLSQILTNQSCGPDSGGAVLFFGRCLCKEGLLYRDTQDVKLSLRGPVSWAGRTAQEKATVKSMQEGHQAISDAIIEKKMKARDPGHPQG